ncbi:MAG: hypothetical protein KDA53_11525 [Hyphomonas sp.]|nr:hypothetical protein [Hyphomonas sp.]
MTSQSSLVPEQQSSGPAGGDFHVFRGSDAMGSLEFFVSGAESGRPLILLNSLEYPGPAPHSFTGPASARGFRTIVVRRPGFGRNAPLPDPVQQAALVMEFIERGGFRDAVLVSNGTANPVGYRIAGVSPCVALSVFANCAFNHPIMSEFQPAWFARALEQALQSPAGARLTLMGLRSSWGVFGRRWVHETVLRKSAGDIAFLRDHADLADDAIDDLVARIDARTFAMEIGASLNHDALLQDACFEGVPALTVSGEETSDQWKAGIESEAARLGLPVAYLPSGDALTVFQSGPQFLDLVASALR